jgi:pimeloyl-ACP methyl ester carboxylesterase
MYLWRVSDVVANGVRLSYLDTGLPGAAPDASPPGAPPLVLLHALGEDSGSWADIIPALSGQFRVIAFDLRGHGRSGWPGPGSYSFELMRDDVLAAADELGLDSVLLIGHSMGGTVATLIAEEQPERVRRLILEDSPPPRPWNRPDPDRPDGPLPFDWDVVPAIRAQLRNPDPAWWDRLPLISAPVLLIGGGPQSQVPQELLPEAAALLRDGKVITIPVGHMVHNTKPAEFTAAVLDFLGR